MTTKLVSSWVLTSLSALIYSQRSIFCQPLGLFTQTVEGLFQEQDYNCKLLGRVIMFGS